MPTTSLVILALGPDAELLQADVAGYPAHGYLLERLRNAGEIEVNVAVPAGVSAPAWCAGYPAFAGKLPPGCEYVVVVDARAWLASGLLGKILATAREEDGFLRVHGISSDHDDAGGHAATLAAAFPAGIFASGVARDVTDVDRLLSWEWARDARRIDASSVETATPSRLLASCTDLAAVEQEILRERAMRALRSGVRVRDPLTLYIRGELSCGADVEIDVNVIVEGTVSLAAGVRVGAHSILRDARIGRRTRIQPYSLVEASSVGDDGLIGPYGRIRPGSTLGDRVQIGNYVEIKSSRIGTGTRINHHSFIGDADLADGVTIGAGTITCNHDGVGNVHTVIERGAYVGSGCKLVAPVRIGEGATIGAGSTITRDVPAGKLTLARSRQATIENWRGPRSRREPRT